VCAAPAASRTVIRGSGAVVRRCYAAHMNAKPRPDHGVYLSALRRQAPEQRLATALELGELSRAMFREGLRLRFPGLSNDDLQRLYLERLAKCHNRRS